MLSNSVDHIEELATIISIEDLKHLNDIAESNDLRNNESFDDEVVSKFSFDSEDLAEWIVEDDELLDKCVKISDKQTLHEFSLLQDDLDNESHSSFDVEDLTEWIEEEQQESSNSLKLSSTDTHRIQFNSITNDNRIIYAHSLKTTRIDNSMSACLARSELNDQDTSTLFHMINSSKIRAEISRQRVLHCQVMTSSLSTHDNQRRRTSFSMDYLKKRRLVFDLHESQKRLKSYSLQSKYIENNGLIGKRMSVSECAADGQETRLRQLRNQTPNNNMALAA